MKIKQIDLQEINAPLPINCQFVAIWINNESIWSGTFKTLANGELLYYNSDSGEFESDQNNQWFNNLTIYIDEISFFVIDETKTKP